MTPETMVLTSQIDRSINFIYDAPEIGVYESRYVRREDDYFIIYLSSQSGCDQACRMCHLTATGQNRLENATYEDFVRQARIVYEHYGRDAGPRAQLVHYNFMARGEALNNPLIRDDSSRLLRTLQTMADERELQSKFLISTILPTTLAGRSLLDLFPDSQVYPEIYYSIYSVNKAFRRRWLPRALPVEEGLERLKAWQEATGKTPKIHFAFIEGENDSEEDMKRMAAAVNGVGLRVNLNIVRYNPHSEKHGRESSEQVIVRNVAILTELLEPEQVRIVPKVGLDVKASCGMFIEPGGRIG